MPSNKFWGDVFDNAVALVAFPVAVANGTLKAIDGQSFEKGFDDIIDPAAKSGRQFGEKHGPEIEKTVVNTVVAVGTIAVIALGAKATGTDKFLHNSARNGTPKLK